MSRSEGRPLCSKETSRQPDERGVREATPESETEPVSKASFGRGEDEDGRGELGGCCRPDLGRSRACRSSGAHEAPSDRWAVPEAADACDDSDESCKS